MQLTVHEPFQPAKCSRSTSSINAVHRRRNSRMRTALLFFATLLCVLGAFPQDAGANRQVTFWTTEVENERINVQKEIGAMFTEKTGIQVKVVPVQENRLAERVTAAFAARSLPDVIFHPIDFTVGWAEAEILDCESATRSVHILGETTFGRGPLNLVKMAQGYAAVSADGWGQLLLYRKDLFEKKGLPVPNTWEKIIAAARTLHNPPFIWGFKAATDPDQIYTQQVFEHIALSNDVRLVNASGNVDLNTPEMVEALNYYKIRPPRQDLCRAGRYLCRHIHRFT